MQPHLWPKNAQTNTGAMMLFWMARRTVRGLTRTQRCNQGPQVSDRDAFKIFLWVISPLVLLMSPLIIMWIIMGGWAALKALAGIPVAAWHTLTTSTPSQLWHGPWPGGLVVVVVLTVLGVLTVIGAKMPQPATPRVEFYPCCGMATSTSHATTCPTRKRPPENPAKYSNRR
jgi:hypothetical protein